MRSKFFAFLHEESMQFSTKPVTKKEITRFIDSEEGQEQFKIFCNNQKMIHSKRLETIFDDIELESKPSQEIPEWRMSC